MNIEIDEKVIREQLAVEVHTITNRVIKRITESYSFENEITRVVRASMAETVDKIIAEQDIEEVRDMVKAAMVKRISGQLTKALKLHDSNSYLGC